MTGQYSHCTLPSKRPVHDRTRSDGLLHHMHDKDVQEISDWSAEHDWLQRAALQEIPRSLHHLTKLHHLILMRNN